MIKGILVLIGAIILIVFGYFVSTQYFSDMTDINIKDLMFKHKMQQIEDDIVPFGFVDNGSETLIELPTEDRPWALETVERDF